MIGAAMEMILAAVGEPTALGHPGGVPAAIAPGAWLLWFVGAGLFGTLLGGASTYLLRRRIERQLRRAVQSRDDHLARTSHELRSPLTAVINALEIVRDGYATTDCERDHFLVQAEQAARHLALLVDDVLDAAAIDAEQLRLLPAVLPIQDLLATCSSTLGMLASRHTGTVQFPVEPLPQCVLADGRRVVQVLFNLVGNALRYSPPGLPVTVSVSLGATTARFEVRDHGPGVAAQVRPRLFEPFVGDDAHRDAAGTGLGLHVSRRLVEQMGGLIGYREEHPGASFWFTLPLVAQLTVAPLPAPSA